MYKLLVTVDQGNKLLGVDKSDGSQFSTNDKNITFIVTSQYSDRFWVDDLIKQNGLVRNNRYGFISGWQHECNGWTIRPM